jgi:hypothetical protein
MGLTRIRAEQISNSDYKQSVRALADQNITLTSSAPAEVDGVSLSADDRILVIAQNTASENGIYRVQTLGTGSNGTWVRSNDANKTGEVLAGMLTMVTEGVEFGDTQWKLITDDPIILDDTALEFRRSGAFEFGNIVANGTAILADTVGDTVNIVAGNNVTITANAESKTIDFSVAGVVGDTGDIQFNNNGVLGASSNLRFTGNTVEIGADVVPLANLAYDLGNSTNSWRSLFVGGNTIFLGGIQLKDTGANTLTILSADGQTPAELASTAANAIFANTAGVANSANLVTASAQPNITSVGTLTALSVTGNVAAGNVSGTIVSGTNVQAGNITVSGDTISSSSNTITIDPATAGPGGLVVIAGNLQVTGTTTTIDSTVVTVNDLAITVANNAASPAEANGGGIIVGGANASMIYNSSSNSFVFNRSTVHSGANINGELTGATTGSFSGNVTAGNLSGVSGVFTNVSGNGAALTSIPAANVTGTLSVNTTGSAATVTTAAQPNITSVGTLTSLAVTGNITGDFIFGNGSQLTGIDATSIQNGTANVKTFANSNVTISAGTVSNVVVISDTGANINGTLVVTGNATTGNISGNTATFDNVSGNGAALTGLNASNIASGTLSADQLSGTYTITVSGAATTAGTVTTAEQPNITSVGTLSSLDVNGNVQANQFIGNGTTLTGINAFSSVFVSGQSTVSANTVQDSLTLSSGSGISILTDPDNKTITIGSISVDSIFSTGGSMDSVEDPVTQSEDLGTIEDSAAIQINLGALVISGLLYPDQLVLPQHTANNLPSASIIGSMIFVTDESGGPVPAFSDGLNWRRVTDRSIVS